MKKLLIAVALLLVAVLTSGCHSPEEEHAECSMDSLKASKGVGTDRTLEYQYYCMVDKGYKIDTTQKTCDYVQGTVGLLHVGCYKKVRRCIGGRANETQ